LEAFDRGLATGIAQSSNPIVLKGAALFTTVGDHDFLMWVVCAVLVMLLWRKQWMLASAWVAASAGGGLLNAMLKALFERARPDHVHGFVHASGFSFPSGHASGAVAVYAMLVFVLLRFIPPARQPALLAAAVALVAAIGFSRVLLHVHYFSDVLAGWAITGAWVALCVLALERVERRYVVTTSG
jgi:undecaprenyl-diphosphatase